MLPLMVFMPASASPVDLNIDLDNPRFVAGYLPSQRPLAAPVIRQFNADVEWRRRALTGISPPLPASLGFLDDQGAWYTPFNRPGMPGYYNLRNWRHGCSPIKHCESITP